MSNSRKPHNTMKAYRLLAGARAFTGALLLLSSAASSGKAQFEKKASAYLARIHTPAGSVPPALLGITLTAPQRGPGVQVSFATVQRPDASFSDDTGEELARERVYAFGVDFPMPFQGLFKAARWGASAGKIVTPCGGGRTCSGYMLGTQFRGSVVQIPLNKDLAHAPVFGIAIDADVGRGKLMSQTSSASFGVPISIAFRTSNRTSLSESDPKYQPRTVLFIQPSIVRGSRKTSDGSDAGSFFEVLAGASVLDFGFGGGASIVARRTSVATTGLSVGVMFSWRMQR